MEVIYSLPKVLATKMYISMLPIKKCKMTYTTYSQE